jgi:hypothetical protein
MFDQGPVWGDWGDAGKIPTTGLFDQGKQRHGQ